MTKHDPDPELQRFDFASGVFKIAGVLVGLGVGAAVDHALDGQVTGDSAILIGIAAGVLVFLGFWFMALVIDLLATIAEAVRK